MKNKLIILFLLLISGIFQALHSQNISQYSINSGCGFYSSQIKIDYSIGQLVLNGYTDKNILNSGVQQPVKKFTKKSVISDTSSNTNISAFPNPADNYLNIIVSTKNELNSINLIITSANGEIYQPKPEIIKYENFIKIKLDLSNYPSGLYIINLFTDNLKTTSFSIVKK